MWYKDQCKQVNIWFREKCYFLKASLSMIVTAVNCILYPIKRCDSVTLETAYCQLNKTLCVTAKVNDINEGNLTN